MHLETDAVASFILKNLGDRCFVGGRPGLTLRADVNTAITVAHAPDPKRKVPPDWSVLFVAVQKPFEEVDLLQEALEASLRVGLAEEVLR